MTIELVEHPSCSACKKTFVNDQILYLHVLYSAEEREDEHVRLLVNYGKESLERALHHFKESKNETQKFSTISRFFLLGVISGCLYMFIALFFPCIYGTSINAFVIIVTFVGTIVLFLMLTGAIYVWKMANEPYHIRKSLFKNQSKMIPFINEVLEGM